MAFSPAPAPAARRASGRSGDVSRGRLLEAAVAVFAEKGFTAARAADIAARAGVAVGTLYLHFGDKEGIARAVALEALQDLRGRLRRAVERAGDDPEAAARAHAAALVDFVSSPGAQAHLLFATDSPGLRGEILDAMAEAQEAHLRERGEDGYFRTDIDPAVAAQALVGMQSRVLIWWNEDRRRASRAAVIDTLAKLRLSGVHARVPDSATSVAARRGARAKTTPSPGRKKP